MPRRTSARTLELAAIHPTELCGTSVTVNGVPVVLLALIESQINLEIPENIKASAEAAIVVTVRGVSSQPVMVPFGNPKGELSLEGVAYDYPQQNRT